MRKLLIAIVFLLVFANTAHADVLSLGGTGGAHPTRALPFSCPDPSAYNYYWWHKVKRGHRSHVVKTPATYVACTSDFNPKVFGIFMSTDRNRDHYTLVTHVFNANNHPDWTGGRFWAPDITRIGNRWVVYFAAYNRYIERFAVGVAWTTNIRQGVWHSKLVHYADQMNSTSTQQEYPTGAIDPGEAYDPYNGMRYLVWSDQAQSVWIAPLSSDGMNVVGTQVYNVLNAQKPIDCSQNGCCIEGSALMFHNGNAYILYSDMSTWDGTYSMRYATNSGSDPLSAFQAADGWILRPNSGWYNTGGGQTPIEVNGHLQLLFHGTTMKNDEKHISAVRLGLSARFTWDGDTPHVGSIA